MSGTESEWEYGDSKVGPHVPKSVRRGGATRPMLKRNLSGNGTAFESHSVVFECTECGDTCRLATAEFMDMYYCDECEDVRWFEFQWDLNRTRETDTEPDDQLVTDGGHSMDDTERCPKCGSEDNTVGFAADFDVRCNDCYVLWDIRDGQVISV